MPRLIPTLFHHTNSHLLILAHTMTPNILIAPQPTVSTPQLLHSPLGPLRPTALRCRHQSIAQQDSLLIRTLSMSIGAHRQRRFHDPTPHRDRCLVLNSNTKKACAMLRSVHLRCSPVPLVYLVRTAAAPSLLVSRPTGVSQIKNLSCPRAHLRFHPPL
jgi:hypothetical protein